MRTKSWMCQGDAARAGEPAACFVSTGLECAQVCEATAGCTGFMVQDNTGQASEKGANNVCQIVSDQEPNSPDLFGFPGWGPTTKWDQDDGGSTATPPTPVIVVRNRPQVDLFKIDKMTHNELKMR